MSRKKVVIVSQHYPPDASTTAAIMAAIAAELAQHSEVVVLSGVAGSSVPAGPDLPHVVEIKNWIPAKAALVRRALAELLFTANIFFTLLRRLRTGDVALTVTAPFALPYAVAAASRLKSARSVLIMHDLFPEVLVIAGLLKPRSGLTRLIRFANRWMFRALDAVVVIGRDTEQVLARYGEAIRGKMHFIPNWTTLTPAVRPISADNPYRKRCGPGFVVGLSGNLGFTHDPLVVFEAARRLSEDRSIHFLLSGWGIGFEKLKALQAGAGLPNVTLVDRVADGQLDLLLSAADLWVIPYRSDVAGVSIPSRFYNLLAIGRPVVLVSEAYAEAALTISENKLGWVVEPGRPDELAEAIREASRRPDPGISARALAIAANFSQQRAMTAYRELVARLLRDGSRP